MFIISHTLLEQKLEESRSHYIPSTYCNSWHIANHNKYLLNEWMKTGTGLWLTFKTPVAFLLWHEDGKLFHVNNNLCVMDALIIHLDWLWCRKLLWLITNGCQGIRKGNDDVFHVYSNSIKTKPILATHSVLFHHRTPHRLGLALPEKEKLPILGRRHPKSYLTIQPLGRNLRSKPKIGLTPLHLTYRQPSNWCFWVLLSQSYMTLKGKF